MKRQVIKGITSYFPMVSKKTANLQTVRNFLELDLQMSTITAPVTNEENKLDDGKILLTNLQILIIYNN